MKQILKETMGYINPTKSLLESLSKDKGNGQVFLFGVIQRADIKNGNGRIYPKHILEREISKLQQVIKEVGYILCHLDHSDDLEIKLKLSCAKIIKLWWEGNDVWGKIELLHESNPESATARSFIKSGIKLGISSRAEGSLKTVGDTHFVQDDLNLATWDIVSVPSTQGAFLNVMKESLVTESTTELQPIVETSNKSKLNSIFSDILDATSGKS